MTCVPGQIAPDGFATMLTDGVEAGLMVTFALPAADAQPAADVTVQPNCTVPLAPAV